MRSIPHAKLIRATLERRNPHIYGFSGGQVSELEFLVEVCDIDSERSAAGRDDIRRREQLGQYTD